jgi:hypothetical protein
VRPVIGLPRSGVFARFLSDLLSYSEHATITVKSGTDVGNSSSRFEYEYEREEQKRETEDGNNIVMPKEGQGTLGRYR